MTDATRKTTMGVSADSANRNCSISKRELSARDYSITFHEIVIRTFLSTQSLKQTARDCGIAARVVSEILHLAHHRRPNGRAVSSVGGLTSGEASPLRSESQRQKGAAA